MTLVKGPMVIQTSHSVKHHRLKDWCMPTDFPQGYADAARCVDGWLPWLPVVSYFLFQKKQLHGLQGWADWSSQASASRIS